MRVEALSNERNTLSNERDTVSHERNTYKREVEENASRLSRADDLNEQASAQHHDAMAATRLKISSLEVQILTERDVHNQKTAEVERLTSKVSELRAAHGAQNATNERRTKRTEDELVRTGKLEAELRGDAEYVDQERKQNQTTHELLERHATETRHCRVQYERHNASLVTEIGK